MIRWVLAIEGKKVESVDFPNVHTEDVLDFLEIGKFFRSPAAIKEGRRYFEEVAVPGGSAPSASPDSFPNEEGRSNPSSL